MSPEGKSLPMQKTNKLPECLSFSFKGFCIAGKKKKNKPTNKTLDVYLMLFLSGFDLSNKGYFLYMNLVGVWYGDFSLRGNSRAVGSAAVPGAPRYPLQGLRGD